MSAATNPAKPAADWERIEADYRAGTRSLREIATEHQITEGAIRKRAKRDEWSRDLKAKVQAKADALVRTALVRSEVRSTQSPTEKQVIEIEATVQSRIRLGHRTDIARARKLGMQLVDEVEAQTTRPELLLEAEQFLAGIPKGGTLADLPEEEQKAARAKLGEALSKAIALGPRAATFKGLVESLSRLISLEREAYGITADDGDLEDPLAKLLTTLKARTFQPVVDDPDHAAA